jgi:hypothetical protein
MHSPKPLWVRCALLSCVFAGSIAAGAQQTGSMILRFVDAETGFVVPSTVRALDGNGTAPLRLSDTGNGRHVLSGEKRRHPVEVAAPGYHKMTAVVDLDSPLPAIFMLQPEQRPAELLAERIGTITRPDATLFLGFIRDDETGRPLSGVRVRTSPSNVEAVSDSRGHFELFVPLPKTASVAVQLSFSKPGYRSEVRQNLELWPRGDWTYRIGLSRGAGENRVDERQTRRWSGAHSPPAGTNQVIAVNAPTALISEPAFLPAASSPATVRVPRTIRVLYTNVVLYETMEGYCRHVLHKEWIASWGGFPGGSNSLQAGAVALRTYAIGFVNQPSAANYDICATTACQVYDPTSTSIPTDAAVNQTAGYVMVSSSGNISRGLTEYSSENNQLGMACGDGFTAPTGGCLYDPVCAGEQEFGHGRGMCQWGSVKWATGLKFPGNNLSNSVLANGQPRRDWAWIVQHYYPNLILARGAPLLIGDDVRATSSTSIRSCADQSITNGVNCPLLGTAAAGDVGLIVGGPEQVTVDGAGHTWWQVQWNSGLTGWVVENFLARVIPVPSAPANLTALTVSANQIDLSWSDGSDVEIGFKVEQAGAVGGPFNQIGITGTNTTAFAVTNLNPQNTYYFRVRAFNLGGDSGYSGVASATTPAPALVLNPIADRTINEGETLNFVATVEGAEVRQNVADFEAFPNNTANGTVMFRSPNLSGSTAAFLDAAPNLSTVTATYPSGHSGTRAMAVSWSFNATADPWLRLTTFGATSLPNPVIDFSRRFQFDMHCDRPLRVGLGLRETTNAPGTAIGSNGGSIGAIEWVGVTNRLNGQPQPTRLVPAGAWTTLTFDLPSEAVFSYVNGNGVLSTASGVGVLEHVALVPAAGPGTYNVFLDNFALVESAPLTFSLDAGVLAGATINATNGSFAWTPTEAQGPATNFITVHVSDHSLPPQTDARTFKAIVNEVNQSPVLAAISNLSIHAGTTLVLSNSASDADLPANALTFSLLAPILSGASVHPVTGILTWPAPDSAVPATNNITVRVADNGVPGLDSIKTFTVRLVPRPSLKAERIGSGGVTLSWSAIPGRRYQVLFTDDLSAAEWEHLGDPAVAQGETVSIADTPPGAQRFYRLLLED